MLGLGVRVSVWVCSMQNGMQHDRDGHKNSPAMCAWGGAHHFIPILNPFGENPNQQVGHACVLLCTLKRGNGWAAMCPWVDI